MANTHPLSFYPGVRDGSYDAARAFDELIEILPGNALLIPLHPRRKNPILKGWADIGSTVILEPKRATLFTGETGIGLVCGTPSSGLCLIDADDDAMAERLTEVIPELARAHRIRGARGCKLLVCSDRLIKGFALLGQDGARAGEYLSHRQQGVMAGIHPDTGLPYAWELGEGIPTVDPDFLCRTFSRYKRSSPIKP